MQSGGETEERESEEEFTAEDAKSAEVRKFGKWVIW
jgi:hypothetical protein